LEQQLNQPLASKLIHIAMLYQIRFLQKQDLHFSFKKALLSILSKRTANPLDCFSQDHFYDQS
jgi:hypothetical protein